MLASGSVTSASPTPSNVARDREDVALFVPLVQQLVEGDATKGKGPRHSARVKAFKLVVGRVTLMLP